MLNTVSGDKKMSFLAFLEPKRCRFRATIIIIFKFCIYKKDVVLDCEGPKRHRFESVVTYPKRRHLG